MPGAGEQRLDVVAQGGRLVLAGRLGLRKDLPQDADGGFRIGHGEDRAHRIALRERDRLRALALQALFQPDETVRREAGDRARVEQPQLDAGGLHHRILGVELGERVDLSGTDKGRGLRALAGDHDGDVAIRVETGRRNQRLGDDHAAG